MEIPQLNSTQLDSINSTPAVYHDDATYPTVSLDDPDSRFFGAICLPVVTRGCGCSTICPSEYLEANYDFEPDDAWVRHVMLSSVRFNSGGSASFVSSTGLVLTNHHVASDTLQKISTPENNYMRDGFLASALQDEVPAPDLELNQLVSIEDVTDRVKAAVTAEMSTADAFRARRAVMAQIEKESLDQTGLRSDVVTLYGGAQVSPVSLQEVHRRAAGLGSGNRRSPSLVGIRTTSSIRGTAWMWPCFASTKTDNRRRSSISCKFSPARCCRWRTGVRLG